MGKKTLVKEIAWEADRPWTFIQMPSSVRAFVNLLLVHEGVLSVHEVERAGAAVRSVMEEFLATQVIRYRHVHEFKKNLSLIATCSNPARLSAQLVEGFRLRIDLDNYSVSEIQEVLERHGVPTDAASSLAPYCRRNMGEASRIWRTYHQLSSSELLSPDDVVDYLGLAAPAGDDGASSRRISADVRRAVWRRDQAQCVECGSRERLEFDHIIPIAKGGSNTERNVQLLCEPCNRKKSDSI